MTLLFIHFIEESMEEKCVLKLLMGKPAGVMDHHGEVDVVVVVVAVVIDPVVEIAMVEIAMVAVEIAMVAVEIAMVTQIDTEAATDFQRIEEPLGGTLEADQGMYRSKHLCCNEK